MEIRALVCTVFVVALFLNIARASVLNVNQPDTSSHAFSMGRDDLKEWVHSHRPRTEQGLRHFDRRDRWYQQSAGADKDSLLESTDFDGQPETVNARILVANVDYAGDYSSVPNNNPLTTPSPSTPPGFRKRRLLQDYSPGANEISSFRRHKGRKLLSDYAEPSPNSSTTH